MFSFDLSDGLTRNLKRLTKKDPVLTIIFRKKVREIINNEQNTIDRYKNLKRPLHDIKQIHLTDSAILLFKVDKEQLHIRFLAIKHWDKAYG